MRSSARMTAVLLCVIALKGCTPYMMKSSAVDQYPLAEQELDFMAAVERMPAVTNNDALHGLLLLQDGQDPNKDFPSRVEAGRLRGWFPVGTPKVADEAAKVGWMATAGCVVMGVKGGLTMHLIGPVPRYATRELVYMEVLPMRTENQILTGGEFIDYLNRLDRIAGRNRRDRPASELGTPMGEGAPPATPVGMPAGESASTPGNEAAIQEGPLPDRGTLPPSEFLDPPESAGPPEPSPFVPMGPPDPSEDSAPVGPPEFVGPPEPIRPPDPILPPPPSATGTDAEPASEPAPVPEQPSAPTPATGSPAPTPPSAPPAASPPKRPDKPSGVPGKLRKAPSEPKPSENPS